MKFFRKGRRAGIDVFLIGNIAVPRVDLGITLIVVSVGFMLTCMAGDMAFGWSGFGIRLFTTVMAIGIGLGVLVGGVILFVKGVKLFRKVNATRSGNDYY